MSTNTNTAPPADTSQTPPAGAARADERLAHTSLPRRLMAMPELGALVGAVGIFVFFSIVSPIFRTPAGISSWLEPASTLGILAVAVAMLLIGGEFDLSVGVLTGTTGLVTAILVTNYGMNMWLASFISLGVALIIGFINGMLVVKSRLPSFIITLGTFLLLQGINVGVTKAVTDNVQIGGLTTASGFTSMHYVFASTVSVAGVDFRVTILWWLGVTALATYVLQRLAFGNWTFAVGGNALAARSVGVPLTRTKVLLFMTTSASAWLVGTMLAVRLGSVQATAGFGLELIAVTAAVIGGCLLTGGYGSAIGASLGAVIFGMTQIGIVYAGWDADWFKAFLGAMLLIAVMSNEFVKRASMKARS